MIYQLILGEKLEFIELIFIDKPLYNSLENLINMKNWSIHIILLYPIYFYLNYKNKRELMFFQDFIKNANEILVTQRNFDLYIEKRNKFFILTQFIWINEIIREIITIFRVNILKIFTSDQLGFLINRTPPIDAHDKR